MSWFEKLIGGGIESVIKSADNLIDNAFTSDEERLRAKAVLEQITAQIRSELITAFSSAMRDRRDVIVAELKGEGWMQRNWRGITMLTFTYIIANQYIVAPYVQAIAGLNLQPQEIPEAMWDLLKLGLGGYIGALGLKKVVENTKWGR